MINELIALVSAAVGLYLAISTRKKNDADAAESIAHAASLVLEMSRKENEDLRKEISRLKRKKKPR